MSTKGTQRHNLRGISVRRKLGLAYAVLILVAIVVASIALHGFLSSRGALEDLRTQSIPEISNALELADQSSTLAAFAPFLGSVRVKSQLEAESARLQTMLEDFSRLLEETIDKSADTSPNPADQAISSLAGDLNEALLNLVTTTQESLGVRSDSLELEHALRKRNDIFERMGAYIYNGSADNTELSAFHRLTEIVFRSQNTESAAALRSLEDEYQRVSRDILAQIDPAQQSFVTQVDAFLQLQRGIFDIRKSQIALQNRITFLISTTNAISNQMSRLVKERVASVTNEVALRGEESANALETSSRTILLLTSIGGLASAAIVFLVLRDLGGNLSLVTQGMSRLSRGDTSVTVPGWERKDEIGSLSRAFKVFREYSIENTRLTEEISKNAKTLEAMFENMTDGISVFNQQGQLVIWNPQFAQMHGIDEKNISTGMSFNELLELMKKTGFEAVSVEGETIRPSDQLEKRQAQILKYEHRLPDNRVIELRSKPLPDGGFVTTYADLTESRELEKQLRSAQRMDAIGQMTGGVAHDFNNLLSVITGNLQLLYQDLTSDSKNAKRALRALDASERGASLTQRLLAFTSQQALKPEVVEIDKLILGLRDLFENDLDGKLSLNLKFDENLPNALVDPGQLETALINLLYNARDAVNDNGQINVSARRSQSAPDAFIEVNVSDNGHGMDADVLSRVYEPFFTTKPSGYGTGLGLSMVYGFVKQSEGNIELESTVGKGTSVRFELPIAKRKPKTPANSISENGRIMGDGEQILLVEDETGVRETALELLEGLGYAVTCAASLSDATEILKQSKFDLLFTDVMLKNDETGLDVAKHARSVDPEIGVLFTSGFGRDEVMKKISGWPDAKLLSKPYRKDELASAVRSQVARSAP